MLLLGGYHSLGHEGERTQGRYPKQKDSLQLLLQEPNLNIRPQGIAPLQQHLDPYTKKSVLIFLGCGLLAGAKEIALPVIVIPVEEDLKEEAWGHGWAANLGRALLLASQHGSLHGRHTSEGKGQLC